MKKLTFTHFPGFAKFLLQDKLDEFVKLQLSLSREVKIPLLKLLEQMPEEQLIELSKLSSTELLSHAVNNTLSLQIEESVKQWKENLLPVMMTREQVVTDDITLSSLIRKKAMLFFLPQYTTDLPLVLAISNEIDEFQQASESALFETFVGIQQEELNRYNAAEAELRKELLAEKLRLADANSQLLQKNQELERSNKELTAFTYVASHDLQEPLRKIMMFSQMYMEREGNTMTPRGKDLPKYMAERRT